MRIAVVRELGPRERRVSLTPTGVGRLASNGHTLIVESGAGANAYLNDSLYVDAGAKITDRPTVLRPPKDASGAEAHTLVLAIDPHLEGLSSAHTVIGIVDPLWQPKAAEELARSGATVFSLDLMPRITRAQTMDVLSSAATVAGTEAALLGARLLPKMFPLMMTAAGTVPPAKVLVLGAGVAGLQAIATARRLGAVVEGYDVRPAAAEQIRSLGANVVELDLATEDSEDTGGYAKAQGAEVQAKQRELLATHVAQADLVITTAAIPGRASPILVTAEMVGAMSPGSVIIDMAAERGGNCELTRLDETVNHGGVAILGPSDLASGSATTASEMLSNNVLAFLEHLTDDQGSLVLNLEDEVTVGTLVARGGEVVHPLVLEKLK